MPGFTNEEAVLAINLTGVTAQILQIRDGLLRDIEIVKGWVAEMEADEDVKAGVHSYMELQGDPENKRAAFEKRLAACLKFEKVLRGAGTRKIGRKKRSD